MPARVSPCACAMTTRTGALGDVCWASGIGTQWSASAMLPPPVRSSSSVEELEPLSKIEQRVEDCRARPALAIAPFPTPVSGGPPPGVGLALPRRALWLTLPLNGCGVAIIWGDGPQGSRG